MEGTPGDLLCPGSVFSVHRLRSRNGCSVRSCGLGSTRREQSSNKPGLLQQCRRAAGARQSCLLPPGIVPERVAQMYRQCLSLQGLAEAPGQRTWAKVLRAARITFNRAADRQARRGQLHAMGRVPHRALCPKTLLGDSSGRGTPRVLGVAVLQLGGTQLGAEGGLICFLHSAEHSPAAARP